MPAFRPAAAAARCTLPLLLLVLLAIPATASAAARTWVSGVGDDANPCSRTAPCKTFAGAVSKTDAGGEIDALESGGFGTVTITKSLTIDGRGFQASVLNSGTPGFIVNAAATDNVVIRNLSITGAVPSGGTCGAGTIGIRLLGAATLDVQHVVIENQLQASVSVAPNVGNTTVLLDDVSIRQGCAQGIDVVPAAGQTASVMVRHSSITGTTTGLHVGTGGHAWLFATPIFGNTLGVMYDGTGVLESFASERIEGNGDNTAAGNGLPTNLFDVLGTTTPLAGPAGAAGPAGPTGAQGPAGTPRTFLRLVADVARTTIAARVHARVRVQYVTTAPGTAVLVLRRGSRVVDTVRQEVASGAGTIAWDGRIGHAAAPAGSYAFELTITGVDGQHDAVSGRVVLH